MCKLGLTRTYTQRRKTSFPSLAPPLSKTTGSIGTEDTVSGCPVILQSDFSRKPLGWYNLGFLQPRVRAPSLNHEIASVNVHGGSSDIGCLIRNQEPH